jgi:hypothetical protein
MQARLPSSTLKAVEGSSAQQNHLMDASMTRRALNLNEECLLQFLSSRGNTEGEEVSGEPVEALTAELKRIHRRDRYVSFPPAILVRRRDKAE